MKESRRTVSSLKESAPLDPGHSASMNASFQSARTEGPEWAALEQRPLGLGALEQTNKSPLAAWDSGIPRPLQQRKTDQPSSGTGATNAGPVPMDGGNAADVRPLASAGLRGQSESLPFLSEIQRSFGSHDVSGVRSHSDADAKSATAAMGALGYASGEDIAFSGRPDLRTAAHEAAHVVQQRQGLSPEGGVGRVGDKLEQQADAVASRVVAGESAEALLGASGTPVPGASGAVQFLKHPGTGQAMDPAEIANLDPGTVHAILADTAKYEASETDVAALKQQVTNLTPDLSKVSQGKKIEDCWLMASIGAIALQRPELLLNRLSQVADSTGKRVLGITLHVNGPDGTPETFTVSEEEVKATAQGKRAGIVQKNMVAPLFELAMGKARAKAQGSTGGSPHDALPTAIGSGNTAPVALEALAGVKPKAVDLSSPASDLETIEREKYPAVLEYAWAEATALSGASPTLAQGKHAVTVESTSGGSVKVRDQQNDGTEITFKPNEILEGRFTKGKSISMSRKDLKKAGVTPQRGKKDHPRQGESRYLLNVSPVKVGNADIGLVGALPAAQEQLFEVGDPGMAKRPDWEKEKFTLELEKVRVPIHLYYVPVKQQPAKGLEGQPVEGNAPGKEAKAGERKADEVKGGEGDIKVEVKK